MPSCLNINAVRVNTFTFYPTQKRAVRIFLNCAKIKKNKHHTKPCVQQFSQQFIDKIKYTNTPHFFASLL